MDKKIILEIKKEIEQHDSIVIFRHRSPDYDAVGSQMGLKHIISQNFKEKVVYAYGDEKYYDFENVDYYDQVSDTVIKESLVIVVDTANKDRVSNMNYKLGKKIIKIDHHQVYQGESYGSINLELPLCSSCSEIIYYMSKKLGLELNDESAKNLFCGIYMDTGGFKYSNTKKTTFTAISELIEYNFDYGDVVNSLETSEYKQLKAVGYAYTNLIIKNSVGYIIFDKDTQKKLLISPNELSNVVSYLGRIKELKTWVVFNYYPNFIRVNIRSRTKYDISRVAQKHSGGGHKNASGAMVYSQEEIDAVLSELMDTVND